MGKRVVVLGGVGEIGRHVSSELAACPEIAELVLADIDGLRLDKLCETISSPKVTGIVLDVNDRHAALAAFAGADLLMNCTSITMFDRVFALAIEAGVDYADLISEPTPGQRAAAASAGILAISGFGSSPGMTNVLVRHAFEEFDDLEEVHISGASVRAIAASPGMLDTILWELSDDAPTRQYFQNGRWHLARAFEGARMVDFPEPVGRHRVCYVSHTETATLPRNFPSLKFCAVRVGWQDELMEDIRVLNKYGLLDRVPLADGQGLTAYDATYQRIWDKFGGRRSEPCLLFTQVEAIGRRDASTIRRIYSLTHPVEWRLDSTGLQTAVCVGVLAQLMVRQGRTATGFVDPEMYFDPFEFIAELQGRGTLSLTWYDEAVDGSVLERNEASGAGTA
jgi:saccharopine dehydrogenase-like NADP-dependent oxidoreductase